MPKPACSRGFSLVELLVALFLLGFALLIGMEIFLQQPKVVDRLEAQRQALRALEGTLESLRAGNLPLATQELTGFATRAGGPSPDDLTVSVEITALPVSGLWEVALTARCTVGREKVVKRVHSMIWRALA